ncbi:MAG: trypsin-like peptidase domain-containing protein [Bryobacteraceae bacterium]
MRKSYHTLALLVLASAPALAQQGHASRVLGEFSAAIEELAHSVGPAVVSIEVRSRAPIDSAEGKQAGFVAEQRGTGSGAIVDASGYIVTNAHVVAGARHIDVSVMSPAEAGGKVEHRHYAGKLVGFDRETDLAVVKIDGAALPVLPFVDSNKLRQGQVVVAMGSPLGLDNTLTVGYVSAISRQLRPDRPNTYIQTDAPINPGNSGGPLLDIEGRIVGLNTLILSQSGGSEGIGFAIPSNLVQMVYKQLREEGHVHRGVIGVISQEITPELAKALSLKRQSGVLISDVLPESPAAAAGLEAGDIVEAIDGRPLEEGRQLMAAVFQHAPGQLMSLDLLRGEERLQKKVTVLEKPRSPASLADLVNEEGHLIRRLGILAVTLDEKVNAVLPNLRKLRGVVVAAIPAEFAGFNPGLQSGDVIYSLNGKAVSTLEELRAGIEPMKPGEAVALYVERDSTLSYVAFNLE